MKRILFLVLWVIMGGMGSWAQALEIYADGHQYGSLQAYAASKKTSAVQSPPIPGTLNSQEEDYIRKEAKQLGIKVDFSKVKTFQVNQKSLSDKDLHKFYVLSVENGVIAALNDFYENKGKSHFQMAHTISSEQLQEAIEHAVATSNNPKLLISEAGKVRIMTLHTQGNSP